MRDLSALERLSVWERGRFALPVERALILLDAALPDAPPGSVARWSIGRRDAALIALRQRLFGAAFDAATRCSECGESLEMTLDAAELLTRHAHDSRLVHDDEGETGAPFANAVNADAANRERSAPSLSVEVDGCRIEVRPPTSADVLAVASAADPGAALLERCARAAPDEAGAVPVSPAAFDSIEAALTDADPLIDLEIVIACPACGGRWTTVFDITSFLWSELDTWARNTLRDVHALAAAYGWSEAQILALSPARRAAYLEMVGA